MLDKADQNQPRGWHEYLAIGIRRRWWILLPMFVVWIAVWVTSRFMPNTYQSDALISAEQEEINNQYVMENVNVNLQNRLSSTTQEVLSRASLQSIISRFHLYQHHPKLGGLFKSKDPVDEMRDDIKIELVGAPGYRGEYFTFKIHYTADTPELAQQVNNELTSLFINENVRAERQLSENTTEFFGKQLDEARAKMEDQEAAVSAFKEKHVGSLPSQLQSNVQILAGLQAQLASTQHALDASTQQKTYLESLLQQYQSAQASLGNNSTTLSAQALDKDLQDMRLQMQDLRTRYMDDYPDIVALKDKIAKTEALKKQADAQIAAQQQQSTKTTGPIDLSAAEGIQRGMPTTIMQIQSQLKANQLEIQNEQQNEKELETQTATYQSRLNVTPETEQELLDISRGFEEAKTNYDSLLQKQTQSQLATNLGQQQQTQRFRIIDPPRLPDKPFAPNRFLISAVGLAAGIVVGLAFATIFELTDLRFRSEKDLEGILPARLLVGLPRLSTREEDRAVLIRHLMEGCAFAVMIFVIFFGNLFSYYNG